MESTDQIESIEDIAEQPAEEASKLLHGQAPAVTAASMRRTASGE